MLQRFHLKRYLQGLFGRAKEVYHEPHCRRMAF
jgi:hypothetical protein